MSGDCEDFWITVPDKAVHPTRVPILEAMLWIGEPLSPINIVDVLDGPVSMWEATHHFSVLETLGVVEPAEAETGGEQPRKDGFDAAYRLKD